MRRIGKGMRFDRLGYSVRLHLFMNGLERKHSQKAIAFFHATPSMECSTTLPEVEKSHARAQQLRMTVAQNTI